jgi:glycerate kinase
VIHDGGPKVPRDVAWLLQHTQKQTFKMRTVDAAVAILEKEGATEAFGLPGAAINPFYSAMRDPLLGAEGAATIFGPQKGASPQDVTLLEAALSHFVDVLAAEIGPRALKAALAPGAGAAGGVGYAAIAVLAATRRPGIDVVLEFTGLAGRLPGAELVITGEGSLDEQSLLGKTPLGVARAAALAGVPVIAVCGRTTLGPEQVRKSGFRELRALTELESNVDRCIAEAGPLLEQLARQIGLQLAAGPPGALPAEALPPEALRPDRRDDSKETLHA